MSVLGARAPLFLVEVLTFSLCVRTRIFVVDVASSSPIMGWNASATESVVSVALSADETSIFSLCMVE